MEYTGWDNYVREQEEEYIDCPLEQRVKDLEKWKDAHSNLIEHDHVDDFNHRMKTLEEWKQRQINQASGIFVHPSERVKVIDKKVWEDIKHWVRSLDNNQVTYGGGMLYLKEAIKKAEGSND